MEPTTAADTPDGPRPADPPPVRLRAELQPDLSRWRWLVKWILALPHVVVLALLWLAYPVLSLVALGAILLTGRYPEPLFDFNVGVLRWTWRVGCYAFGPLTTDRYPPFTLDSRPDYPADLVVDHPQRLSRGLALVKWWLLAIPHYLVVGALTGGGWQAVDEADGAGPLGLVSVLVLIAAVSLLFTGRYPRGLFDLVVGLDRWVVRVVAYASLMTDVYPPFRLDQGGDEPGHAPADHSPAALAGHGGTTATRPWSAGRVAAVLASCLALVMAAGLLLAGLMLRQVDATDRDAGGFISGADFAVRSEGHAVVSEPVEIHLPERLDALPRRVLGKVKVAVSAGPDEDVFVGVARSAELEEYLSGVRYSTVREVVAGRRAIYSESEGEREPEPPGETAIWQDSVSGPGRQELVVEPEEGEWSVVVMRADASAPVEAQVRVGATVPWVLRVAVGLLVGGLVLAALGGVGLSLALHQPRHGG